MASEPVCPNPLKFGPALSDSEKGGALPLGWGLSRRELLVWCFVSLTLPVLLAGLRTTGGPVTVAAVRLAQPVQRALATPAVAQLDLNSATVEELELVPGIGPSRAQRIVSLRAASGPFASVDALSAIPSFTPRLRSRLACYLRTGPPAGQAVPLTER